MDTILLTKGVVIGSIVILCIYDIYVAVNKKTGDTISEIITEASMRRPMIPFAFGALMGHWFW